MSGLTLRLKSAPSERLDLARLTPNGLSGLSLAEIGNLTIGTGRHQITAGDAFSISGTPGGTLTFQGTTQRCDFLGADLDGGTVIIDGDAGDFCGRGMRSGRLEIRGNAGAALASGMSGGLVIVNGSAGDNLGGVLAGDRFGMSGGIVHVAGDAGMRAGDRMRRGTIVTRGKCGPNAASRMAGGTIWAEGGFASSPGMLLRRGTLVAPNIESMLPTFADCGVHDLGILRLLNGYLAAALGPLAPKPITAPVRRYAGDLATIGKGEILVLV